MRILVTGASGFVGRRLCARLAARADVELHTCSRRAPRVLPDSPGSPNSSGTWHALDLADRAATVRLVRSLAPDRVLHLGAMAEPRECARDPLVALRVNAGGTAAVLAGLTDSERAGRMLLVSTSQVYGRPGSEPLRESDALAADNAYGRSKRAAEAAAREAARCGVEVVIARPFNHSGPGQSASYVLPALARQVVAARASARDEDRVLRTGNLWPRRDFLHVDDVLDAYELLLEAGRAGESYNVCSGTAVSIEELLRGVLRALGVELTSELDPARARADDAPLQVGDASRLRALGWRPRRDLEQLLADVVADAVARS